MNTLSSEYPIKLLCHTLQVSSSGFYSQNKAGPRAQSNATLLQEIQRIYRQHKGRYGSPRITLQLRREGFACNEKRVARLMREAGLAGLTPRHKKPKTTDSRHGGLISPNLVKGLNIKHINQVWVMDITYIKTAEGWVYLAAALDMHSRKIIAWQMGKSLHASLVLSALNRALTQRGSHPGLIIHSDRGSQFASAAFRELLEQNNLSQSMSAKGNCYDNATMESFFGTLKREELDELDFEDEREVRAVVFEYIETYYNRERIHTSLGGGMSPEEYEEVVGFPPFAGHVLILGYG